MKKIAVFTATRAEYGHLKGILKYFQKNTNIDLQLLCGGSHFSNTFGETSEEIKSDGFNITEKIDYLLASDTPESIVKSLGLVTLLSSDILIRLKPDILIVLGDRYETLGICQAAMILKIPIAHIHGGERTEGAIDEAIRHSVTKMAHLHFTSTEEYRKRVIQLGETPSTVFNFGAPSLDNLHTFRRYSCEEIFSQFGISHISGDFVIVTYHPVTLLPDGGIHEFKVLLSCLKSRQNISIIFTYPNADTYGSEIIQLIKNFGQSFPSRTGIVKSLGQDRYFSLAKMSAAVIGNSSSGIIEIPSLCIPSINIGDRQKGRVSAKSVQHVPANQDAISKALDICLLPKFRSSLEGQYNPHGNGMAAEKITNKIIDSVSSINLQKKFHDL
jgi:UDP-hydrolysing UDP-N-acetyl-D-glucosamine 2-epimerase